MRYGNFSRSVSVKDDLVAQKTWKQLLKSPHCCRWLLSAQEEMSSLQGMSTWKLVPPPNARKVIRCKWVFKVKHREDGSVLKLKAPLIAMAFSQVQGLDFSEVFAPTLQMESLRLVFALLGHKDWVGRQIDFKTAFLNGRLDEPVYMSQPPGFEDPSRPDWVCEVSRAIYGLRQSPRQWNLELSSAMTSLGMTQSSYDPSLFYKLENGVLVGTVAAHVDELAVVGMPNFVKNFITDISSKFKVGSDEELHLFLSLSVQRDRKSKTVSIGQPHYIESVSNRFLSPTNFKTVQSPTSKSFKLLQKQLLETPKAPPEYNQLIGSLLWISQCTRPDVAFVVNRLSQFLQDPSLNHWHAALRVLQYLSSSRNLRLVLGGQSLNLTGYADSDWAEDSNDRRSTSGYTYRLGLSVISWKSKKQPTVSLSSTEAEYKSLSNACKEGLWLRNLMSELHLCKSVPVALFVNNSGAKALAKNPLHHSRTKHIDARHHFIRECVNWSLFKVCHVPTADMLANMLTKPLPRVMLQKHRFLFGLV